METQIRPTDTLESFNNILVSMQGNVCHLDFTIEVYMWLMLTGAALPTLHLSRSHLLKYIVKYKKLSFLWPTWSF